MKHLSIVLACALFALICLSPALAAQEPDVAGAKDHPLFNRMPGFRISGYEEVKFTNHPFFLAPGKEVKVEGRLYRIRYARQEGAQEVSRLQVHRNYENAMARIGGKTLHSDDDGNLYMKLAKDGKELWVHVSAYITSEWDLYIVEKGAMAQEVVANAEAFAGDINATGHAAVYGIYFDTGKAVVKPESETALAEIARLLKKMPALRIWVVGHTDNTGTMETNMNLSKARAEAVVQALTGKFGIAAERLKGYGVGALAPVASNDSEAGRAKNRRVELVKQ